MTRGVKISLMKKTLKKIVLPIVSLVLVGILIFKFIFGRSAKFVYIMDNLK
jgi:hypothetical protein